MLKRFRTWLNTPRYEVKLAHRSTAAERYYLQHRCRCHGVYTSTSK
jgi:hypothetical protein